MAYLDHAATTPVFPEALAEFVKVASVEANPSSLHGSGRRARRVLEQAREKVAECLGAHPTEVVFTSGGTEADNLAIKGIYWARRKADPGRRVVIVPATEHHAVLDTVNWLVTHEQAQVEWLPVDGAGRVSAAALTELLDRHGDAVALVTAMWANNEIGTIAPVAELAAVAKSRRVPFHTDAVQAIGAVPVRFGDSGVSALSLTGHKFGAPMGTGALLLGRGVACDPVLHGGGQERLVRSGTLNAAGAAALAVAVELAVAHQAAQALRLRGLRDDLVARVLREVPEALLNGDPGPARLPGNAHFTFPGCEGDALLMLLDARGVECSTGSACTAGVPEPSHVMLAVGANPAWARESLRFSLGHTSTAADVDTLVAAIGDAVSRARLAGATRRR